MRRFPLAAAFTGHLPALVSVADDTSETWLSVPRAEIVIVVGKHGSRVVGPQWEHAFDAHATTLDFEITPGRRMVLRREGDRWIGEYFHPRVRPGDHEFEKHIMVFDRANAGTR
jgi:hypothetical protein